MNTKTIDVLLGTPLKEAPAGSPTVTVTETPPARTGDEASTPETTGHGSGSRVVQCPICSTLGFLSSPETLPGWTVCNRCGQTYSLP